MSRTLTASDRKSLIKLASTLPKGSPERKAILAGLFSSDIDPDRMEGMNKIENMIKPLTKRNGPFDKIIKLIAEEMRWAGDDEMYDDLNEVAKKVMEARESLDHAVSVLRRY